MQVFWIGNGKSIWVCVTEIINSGKWEGLQLLQCLQHLHSSFSSLSYSTEITPYPNELFVVYNLPYFYSNVADFARFQVNFEKYLNEPNEYLIGVDNFWLCNKENSDTSRFQKVIIEIQI